MFYSYICKLKIKRIIYDYEENHFIGIPLCYVFNIICPRNLCR